MHDTQRHRFLCVTRLNFFQSPSILPSQRYLYIGGEPGLNMRAVFLGYFKTHVDLEINTLGNISNNGNQNNLFVTVSNDELSERFLAIL